MQRLSRDLRWLIGCYVAVEDILTMMLLNRQWATTMQNIVACPKCGEWKTHRKLPRNVSWRQEWICFDCDCPRYIACHTCGVPSPINGEDRDYWCINGHLSNICPCCYYPATLTGCIPSYTDVVYSTVIKKYSELHFQPINPQNIGQFKDTVYRWHCPNCSRIFYVHY